MFIAEIGINHNGDLGTALRLIDVAAEAGADVVKFQKRNPEICVPEEQKHVMRDTIFGRMQYIKYKHKIEFGKKEYDIIDSHCKKVGIKWTASVWDTDSLKFLIGYDVPFIKIASASLTDMTLLKAIKDTNKPVVMSTGMSTSDEIEKAVGIFSAGPTGILHCNSAYPSPYEEINLNCMLTLKEKYPQHTIGYSGHEEGYLPTLMAKTLGAEIMERHITLDRTMPGTDQKASLEPWELKELMEKLRCIPLIKGSGKKAVYPSEWAVRKKLRK